MAKSSKKNIPRTQNTPSDDEGRLLPLDMVDSGGLQDKNEDEAVLFSLDINNGSQGHAPISKPTAKPVRTTPKKQTVQTLFNIPQPVNTPPTIQNPSPAPVPAQKQKKGCGCKTILIAWLWLGILAAIFNSEYVQNLKTKAEEMLKEIETALENPEEEFAKLKNNKPLLHLYHDNLDFQLVDGDTTISIESLNPVSDSVIILDTTILSRHRYYLPDGTLKYNLSKKKKNKKVKGDTYVYLVDKFFYVKTKIEPEAKVVFTDKLGSPGFKVKIKDLRFYKEVGLIVIYNDFDYYLNKKNDTLYVPETLYSAIKNGIQTDTLSIKGCGVYAYYQ